MPGSSVGRPEGGPVVEVVEIEAPATYDLRRRVLRSHLPGADVRNPEDEVPGAFHLGVVDDAGSVVAVATFSPEPTPHRPGARAARLRGMAVEPALQGSGVGSLLLDAAVRRLGAEGFEVVWANARDSALAFYERRGWQVVGDPFVTVGLPHHAIVLDLPVQGGAEVRG